MDTPSSPPAPRSSTPLPLATWVVVILLSLAGQVAWNVENSWFNTFVFDTITPDPAAVAWMVAVSAVTATLTTFVMGTLSDRAGKRKPFLVYGYLLWGLATAAFPTAAYIRPLGLAIFAVVLLDALMTFFGSTANDAVFNAWLADITDPTNRARVMGAIAIMPLLVTGLTAVIAGLMIDNLGYFVFFYALGGFVLVVGLVTAPWIKESPVLAPAHGAASYGRQLLEIFRPETLRSNRSLYLLFCSVMLVGIADQISLPYLFVYLENYIGISKTTIGVVTLVLTLVAGGLAIGFSQFIDRWDRRRTAIAIVLFYPVGVFIFSLLRSVTAFYLLGALYVAPMLLSGVINGAWSMDLYPQQSRGQFQGMRMIFQVLLPMLIGPQIGAAIIARTGIPTALNGAAGYIPTPYLWWGTALVGLLGVIPLLLIKPRKPAP